MRLRNKTDAVSFTLANDNAKIIMQCKCRNMSIAQYVRRFSHKTHL